MDFVVAKEKFLGVVVGQNGRFNSNFPGGMAHGYLGGEEHLG